MMVIRQLLTVYQKAKILSTNFSEISEKVQKSLITPIMSRLHRLEGIETKEKSVESFFKICVIRERKISFSELSFPNF